MNSSLFHLKRTLEFFRPLLVLFIMLHGWAWLGAQVLTNAAADMPTDQYMAFVANQSLFYYSDVGYQNTDHAVLLAANANQGGSMIYETLDQPVYVVGIDDDVYIAVDPQELSDHLEGQTLEFQTHYELQINSPSNEPNANLSLFILQLEQDLSGERFMYVGGIGISVIEDVDPNTFQGIQIPNGQVFSLETISTVSSGCNGSGNHALVIRW